MKLPSTFSVRDPRDKSTKFPKRVFLTFTSEYSTIGVEYELHTTRSAYRVTAGDSSRWYVYKRLEDV